MKKIITAIVATLMLFSALSVNSLAASIYSYDLNEYLSPIWDGNKVYDESVTIVQQADGTFLPISLAYPIEEIEHVVCKALRSTYTNGVDFIVQNGKFVPLQNTLMPFLTYAQAYPDFYTQGSSLYKTGGGYIYWAEGSTFHYLQVTITYSHSASWTGSYPSAKATELPKTMEKLKNKQALRLLFYGDSITVGANTSSYVSVSPNMPIWPRLVANSLRAKWGSTVSYNNTAVGGTTSAWGVENAALQAVAKKPDLMFIAFGMNDGTTTLAAYKANIKAIIDTVRVSYPNCEFVLVSTMLPNPEARDLIGNQALYVSALSELSQEYDGVALADVTSLHQALLSKKSYVDMTGSNANHPNDFLARMYAQTCLETLSFGRMDGDADRNGEVNTTDARTALKAAVGSVNLDAIATANADANKDGYVTTTDARKILYNAVSN